MKQLPLLLVLGLAISLCNLTERIRQAGSSGGSEPTSASKSGAPVEKAQPTAAQAAAIAGGQNVTWEKQGMSWTLPANWTKTTDETKSLIWRSPGSFDAASLIVSISPMDRNFPTEDSIQAFYDGAKTRMENGEVDELKWVEIDGLKGVQFRESNPETPDGFRRLQWLAYRTYAGQVQMINVMVSTTGKDFPRHQDTMYGVLYSTKVVH